jgi:hypothetical protein
MELLQLVDVRVEETSRPLREEVATLKLLLTPVGDSLEPPKACTSGGLGLAPAGFFSLDSTEQKSSMVEEEHHHVCFSSRSGPYPAPQPYESVASESAWMGSWLR